MIIGLWHHGIPAVKFFCTLLRLNGYETVEWMTFPEFSVNNCSSDKVFILCNLNDVEQLRSIKKLDGIIIRMGICIEGTIDWDYEICEWESVKDLYSKCSNVVKEIINER